MTPARYHLVAIVSLIALIVLCVLWEALLAPVRPGSFWLAIKAAPLLLPLKGVMAGKRYTLQWSTLLIWLYFTEGVVRAFSDRGLAQRLAALEVGLSLVFFVAVVLFLRTSKKSEDSRQLPG
jgi:uncharacterized membrane protein